jgi:proline iminopeptidase
MTNLYPESEPYDHGLLDVGDGNQIYWEVCGNPQGRPAVVLHGGPGSGCTPWFRRLFDPDVHRIVLCDQRNCGRSKPHASDFETDLSNNTTANLVGDIERLRRELGIERWLVLGGSWGSTLALAYAESKPAIVSGLILFGVTTGRHSEVDWLFRGGLAAAFPQQWQRLLDVLPADERDGDVVAAYHRRLNNPDAAVREVAANAWCLWESATPDWPPSDALAPRFRNPRFAMAYARIVTHYMHHNLWLEDGILLRNATLLADTPGILINGRHDVQAPLANAEALRAVWPAAELVVIEDAGHAATSPGVEQALVAATDRFGALRP